MGEDCGVHIADIGGAGCVEMVEKVGMREEGKGNLRQNRRELWLENVDEEMGRGVEGLEE